MNELTTLLAPVLLIGPTHTVAARESPWQVEARAGGSSSEALSFMSTEVGPAWRV